MNCDLLIRNGIVMDGTGMPAYRACVAVTGDRISGVGAAEDFCAKRVIDAENHVVAPGFIDSHCHYDLAPFPQTGYEDSGLSYRLCQGVTTLVTGCCGTSPAPVLAQSRPEWLAQGCGLKENDWVRWQSFGEYLDALNRCGLGTNFASYVGHGALRFAAMGFSSAKPTRAQMEQMKLMLREALDAGALGMSTGLVYPPGIFADTQELSELSGVLKGTGAIYASHMRSESEGWLNAVAEVLQIARENGIPVILHHIKIQYVATDELVASFFDLIGRARAEGLDVGFEQYPYDAAATALSTMLPAWAKAGDIEARLHRLEQPELFARIAEDVRRENGWNTTQEERRGCDRVLILRGNGCDAYLQKTLTQASDEMHTLPLEAMRRILIQSKLTAACAYFGMREKDIVAFMKMSRTMIGSDGGPSLGITGVKNVHPRYNGTFPKILGRYAREQGVFSMEEAVHRMTGLPAVRFGLKGRGFIRTGAFADLTLFDPETVRDEATYADSFRKPTGIRTVIVNGRIALDDGAITGSLAGRVLRRGREI